MARTKSSASWMARHLSDPCVKQAQKDGYRSRSAYKLIELNEKGVNINNDIGFKTFIKSYFRVLLSTFCAKHKQKLKILNKN